MKKSLFTAISLVLTLNVSAQIFQRDEVSGFYHYTGAEVDQIIGVTFEDLQPTDVAYTTGTTHDSKTILEFQQLGLYKMCYYASRSVGGLNYGPVLWNNNSADDGKNNAVEVGYRPAIYTPKFTKGINKVIIQGWAASSGSMFVYVRNTSGDWVGIQDVVPAARANMLLQSNKYTIDTLIVNSADVKEMCFNRNGGGYFFITNIQIIPMGHESDVIAVNEFSLPNKHLEMEVSQVETLTTRIRPFHATNQSVNWTSSDETKAIVVDGVVTAIGAGECFVYAECGEFKDTCTLNIKGEIPVASVTLSEHSLRVAEGKYVRLSADVLPLDASNPTITWTSSDTTKATVNGGLIQGVVEGNVLIIATAGEKSDTCKVEVYWEMPEASDFILTEYYKGGYYYKWYGDLQTEPISIDFTQWTYDSLPDALWPDFATTNMYAHSDEIVQRNNIGFYGWTIYEGRNLEANGYMGSDGSVVANVLYNCGYMYVDGERQGAGSILQTKRPAIYLPEFKYGIKQVRLTGVNHKADRTLFVGYNTIEPDSHGQDSLVMGGLSSLTIGQVWDEYVVDNPINDAVKDMRLSRNSQEYCFFGSLEVIPFTPTGIQEALLDTRVEARGVQGGILINAKENVVVDIYSLVGAKLYTVRVFAGVHTIIPMPQGVYITNNQKVVVE